MSGGRSEFSIDDAFELSLEEGGPGPGGTPPRFGTLHFERKSRGDVEEEGEKQSRLKYQNLENDEDAVRSPSDPDGAMKLSRDAGRSSTRSSQWSFSTISNSTQRSYHACCSWTKHPLIQKNRRVVLASFLLLLLGLSQAFSRCFQCHLLCPWLPVAHPWSVPRHFHLLRCQGSPRLPVFLLALL
ncbi:transmembrane protein 134 isoform X3 [Dromiciops gliroides]|uniref:transmembrane protein 134 isoform X3 n=1 Tax=Dromiciops gliroides TaxID=33562 RepID=UPI001CC6B8C9|nr:transmembrane protein 134 isoform X3 [Dromiciops gliroides]